MIPIREAINNNLWLQFESNLKDLIFRLKIKSFKPIDLSEVDNPEEIQNNLEGLWWIMNIECINLTKQNLYHFTFKRYIQIKDNDSFLFNYNDNKHLSLYSDFAENSGLRNLYATDLIPKIKYTGALLFFLPDEVDQDYTIALENGIVYEI